MDERPDLKPLGVSVPFMSGASPTDVADWNVSLRGIRHNIHQRRMLVLIVALVGLGVGIGAIPAASGAGYSARAPAPFCLPPKSKIPPRPVWARSIFAFAAMAMGGRLIAQSAKGSCSRAIRA